ncbi:hypothetical protein [Moraxella lacunata]|uniref:hypothetical protein n=1 Tax=Moraxella lacunata TaxID=477 RepID=UPI003EE2BDE5
MIINHIRIQIIKNTLLSLDWNGLYILNSLFNGLYWLNIHNNSYYLSIIIHLIFFFKHLSV